MNTHKNARLTFQGRVLRIRRIGEHGLRPVEAAQAMSISARTAYKWLARYRAEGEPGLFDRSCRPRRCPHQLSAPLPRRIVALRRQRLIYRQINASTGVPVSTICGVLRARGLNRLSARDPCPPAHRYAHDVPGDMRHLDSKTLNRFAQPGHRVTGDRTTKSRGAGWAYVHVAIDDHSRVAHATLGPDETGRSAVRVLIATLRYDRRLGVSLRALLTDNGACYQSRIFARACRLLGLKHRRTRPYRPRTNGKAERLIQTHYTNGRMRTSTTTPTSGRPICRAGCTTTTGIGHMPA